MSGLRRKGSSSRAPRWRRLTPIVLQAAVVGSLLVVGQDPSPAQTSPPAGETGIGCRERAIISCQPNATSQAELVQMREDARRSLAVFGGEGVNPADVQVRFVGRARVGDFSAEEPIAEAANTDPAPGGPAPEPGRPSRTWRVFNPATQNEFEILVPQPIREAVDYFLDLRDAKDPNRGASTGRERAPEATPAVPTLSTEGGEVGIQPASWSGGSDSRVRLRPTSNYPWRTVGDMGGCTGTLIGPRLVITAGHCLYSQTNKAYFGSITFQPQRDANNVPFSSTLDTAANPGRVFVPSGWRQDTAPAGGYGQFDIGMFVIPDPLGNQVGWMGYGTLGSADLKARTHLLRGYPYCEWETNGGGERIDEPNPCVENAFYGGESCTLGDFVIPDSTGWNRRVYHGCDASAANSGAALYTYLDNGPWVFMVHTRSAKCRNPGDPPCTAADTHPLVATRITPEYRTWLSWFRNMYP